MHVRLAVVFLLGAFSVTACQENVAPDESSARPSFNTSEVPFGEGEAVSAVLAKLNSKLAAKRSKLRIGKAELIVDPNVWNGASSTVLIANDRIRGLAYEWVAGDARRNHRVGLTYAVDPVLTAPNHNLALDPTILTRPATRNPDGSNRRSVPNAQLDIQIEEGMTAWRNQTCSDAPIQRVAVPAGVDPDQLDQVILGQRINSNYAQVADVVQSGWLPPVFFEAIQTGGGTGIIGVAFSFWFVDDKGTPTEADDVPTDVNSDGRLDTGLVEIYYNNAFFWGTTRALNVVDFYSIIAHETGHSLGLAHFGQVFVTKKDAADGLQIADIKYAPLALMNAVYVTGRNEIAGSDLSSYCMIWGSKN
jgi:hypothetical protein